MMPNFDEMSTRELKEYAKEDGIDLGAAKKKDDIVTLIKNHYNMNNKEDVPMEENKELNQDVNVEGGSNVEGGAADEMTPNKEVDNTDPNAAGEGTGTDNKEDDKKVWHDNAGNEVSMSQFIREKFTVDNMSRKEIADTYKINYRTVYGATVNMENAAEPSSRGRGVVNPKILVTADNKVLTKVVVAPAVEADPEKGIEAKAEEVKYFLNNEEILPGEDGQVIVPETVETDRNTWIKEQVAAGVNRGDVAKALDLSYGVVYGLTKEEDGTRQKHEIEIDDPEKPGEKKMVSRSEYIRMRVAEGISKSDVAKELGVEYSVVWQATKKDKADDEKLADTIASLEKFADKMEDAEGFKAAVEAIKAFKFKPEEKKEEGENKDANAEASAEATTEGSENNA